ncbi:MAG: YfhO family protein [Balneolaceae bacterium]|nr:YfhO family protein [Balneolaceae bacterium]
MARRKGKQGGPEPDFWDKLSTGKQHLLALGFLFLLPFFLHFSSTLGGQQYMGSDVIQWRAGAESLIEYKEETGEIAHWATNMFSGMPANTISHPPKVMNLDNTLLSFLDFIYPAAQMWILLGGAYLMFIMLGSRPLSAVFGAIAIGFTTYVALIIGAGHKAKFVAYIYIPWLYVGYLMITRSQKNRWISFFIFALALTLHLRAYHPQITYYFLFPLGTLFIYDWVKAIKEDQSKKFLKYSGWLVGAGIVAIFITFQMYWSTLEYSPYSMRGGTAAAGTDGLARDYAFGWSQGWGELLTLLIPGAYGGSELYWGPKSFTSGPHYFGAFAFLFFMFGLMKSSHKFKHLFLWPGVAAVLFSLGEHFGLLNNLMFGFFPLFDKFRVPETWLIMAIFCFSAISVFGLDWLITEIRKRMQKGNWKMPLFISSAIALGAILIALQGLSFEKPGERQQLEQRVAVQNNVSVDDPRVSQTVSNLLQTQIIPERKDLAQKDAIRFALLFVIGAGIIWAMGAGKIPISAGAISLCVILAYDLMSVDKRYMSESALVDDDTSREEVIQQRQRGLDQFVSENVSHEEGWEYRVFPILDNPFNNAIPAYFYPSVGGYSGAKLGYYQDLIDRYFRDFIGQMYRSGATNANTGVLNMLNVKYVTAPQPFSPPGFEVVHPTDQGVVMENLNVLPKAFFADSVAVMENQQEVLNQLTGDFDPTKTAYVTQESSLNIQADSTASVTVTEYNPNYISLDISRSEPGFLVLSEIWYPPGWTATLNGEEMDIIRTNYVLRGFEIPAGNHTLEMTLEPVWYTTGKWIARFGNLLLFGMGAIGIFIFFRNRDT